MRQNLLSKLSNTRSNWLWLTNRTISRLGECRQISIAVSPILTDNSITARKKANPKWVGLQSTPERIRTCIRIRRKNALFPTRRCRIRCSWRTERPRRSRSAGGHRRVAKAVGGRKGRRTGDGGQGCSQTAIIEVCVRRAGRECFSPLCLELHFLRKPPN